jgi:uncharacterized protein DUF4384
MTIVDCVRSPVRWRRQGTIIVLLGPIILSSCAAAPLLVPVAFEFARNLFQTSLQNYGSKHRDNLSNLVNRLASPYMQNLPPVAMGGPGMPGQPGLPGQQGFTGQPGGFPGQPGMPQQQYPGQQNFPGQASGYDPNNPYGAGGTTYPGANPSYPGTAAVSPYGQQQVNPYGTPSPYGQQPSPYGANSPNPYGGQNPYGSPNPYGGTVYPPQPGQPNPYGSTNPYGAGGAVQGYGQPQAGYGQMQPGYDPNNPYGTGGTAQGYGQPQAGYGQVQPGYDPNNPYGTGGTAQGYGAQQQQAYNNPNNPYGAGGIAQGYGQPQAGYGQAQPGYGTPNPYGTQQSQQVYGGYGTSGQQYGSQPYGGTGIYPRSVGPEPVAVDVAMVRQKQTAKGKEVVLMNDGEVLKDGGANKEAGDRFKIVVRTNCDCYLYITSIDGSGWAEPVFPVKDGKTPNPVKQDQEYAFPEGPQWFSLDQVKGIETFYVVASANRRTDLEESMAALAAETRPPVKIVAKVEEPPVIPRGVGFVNTRGIIKVQDETGTSTQVTPLSYAASQPGQDVTVTRWFKHE